MLSCSLSTVQTAPQGFGKKKSLVGTVRPKKKKVPVVENVANDEVPWATGSTVQEEASASTLMDDGDDVALEEAKVQEKELKVWVKGSVDKARKLVAECKVHVRKAEAALRHEERLAEERERRWWAAERHQGSRFNIIPLLTQHVLTPVFSGVYPY